MITSRYGQIEGIERDGCLFYPGIPYAAPPVGDLRWRAPMPPKPWQGVLKADHFPPRAMQTADRGNGFYDKEFRDEPAYLTKPEEDCLYLNIWTPKDAAGKKLPVAFWIHGGAFLGGSGIEKEFDGAAYCRRGVVLVSINYRLGVFGFLAHPWLSEESENHVSGNYGILDQIAALKWVHGNIAAFGGDPENITVFGQSAGAMSAQTLISSPLTGSLIKKAIFQSGGGCGTGLNRDDLTLNIMEEFGREFSRLAKAESADDLRRLSAEEIQAMTGPFMQAVFPRSGGLFLVPNIDGYVLPDNYTAAIEKGTIRHIPYLLGSNTDDILTTPEQKAKGEKGPLETGCARFAEILDRQNRIPAYVYSFTRRLPGDDAGAFHSAELWYTFGTLKRAWRPVTPADEALSERMLDFWTNFMKTGDPNGDGLPRWVPYRPDQPSVMTFDV